MNASSIRIPLALLMGASVLAGCPQPHRPGPYDPLLADLGPVAEPLPEGEEALLAAADEAAAHGPESAYMVRSLRCANAVLAERPDDQEAAWRAARALYFLSELAGGGDEAADLAARCIDISAVATRSGDSAAGFYYAALCMGARAQVRSLEAIGLLPQMVDAGRTALELDPLVVHAGPHRLLGGIYLRAPAWPTSVGDIDEALTQLGKAVALAPDWAENQLFWAEALEADERTEEARAALAEAERLMAVPEMAAWARLWAADVEKLKK
ncbi:MAG: hypothetical protein KC933_26320, partial [Myxococcales bacterium]|nr:hypothetical protein [Myxococcales bacterium]